jgi:predicted nucleic acid-binding protein
MIYVDTNVIISYADEKDPNHDKVITMSMQLDRDRAVSQLTLLELASIYARADLEKTNTAGHVLNQEIRRLNSWNRS